ncbi:MAG: helix-turn-helix domain-containing protein [Ruminococcaceae bacterium]|nr:helix-turn-helix domain-containing protein [Oscillospiraceae bacterium]
MHIDYDVGRLKAIVDSLCVLTGLSMAVADHERQVLYSHTKERDAFCERIHREQPMACVCSDHELMDKCVQSRAPVSHLCHAGILDTVVPIIKEGAVVAYIFIGRIRPTFHARDNRHLDGLPEDIRREYARLSYLTRDRLDALLELLPLVFFDNAIRIRHDELMTRVIRYVDAHLGEKLTVEGLCKAMFVSKNTLYEGFHTFCGCTVGEYVTRRRLEEACRRLEDTDRRAQDIARELGFDNYAYFSRLFKKHTGRSPTEYRRHSV